MAIGHALTVTRRAAPGSRTEGADEPPGTADPEAGTDAAGGVEAPPEAVQPAQTPDAEAATEAEPDAEAADEAAEEPVDEASEPDESDEVGEATETDEGSDVDEGGDVDEGSDVDEATETGEAADVEEAGAEPEPIPREPALVGSLRRVRAELAAIRFPLALPDAGTAAESARTLATQLDDYLLPRLALLDAPDLDSVVAANRALADQVHRSADLWLCVTTAVRYADAVPWAALRAARDRGTRLALLLNRVPVGADEEILGHLGELLDAEGLSGIQLFVLPEVVLDGQGLLTEEQVAPIGTWLEELAAD